ncbi:MAG: DUF1109 family protein [Myxococcales bacterium]|nr:DUF1109 family protein [Myxococcales bacterium]
MSSSPDQPSVVLRDRVLAAARQQPSPTRLDRRRRVLVVYSLAGLAMLAIFQFAGGLAHGQGRPVELTVAIATGAAALALAVSVVAAGRRRSMLGHPTSQLALVALATPVVANVWLITFASSYAEPFERIGWRCLGFDVGARFHGAAGVDVVASAICCSGP